MSISGHFDLKMEDTAQEETEEMARVGQFQEIDVGQTWTESGSLGVGLMARCEVQLNPQFVKAGVIVSDVKEGASVVAETGMLVAKINGNDTKKESLNEVQKALAVRPVTVVFRSTIEQQLLEYMVQEFLKADEDMSGALDREEVSPHVTR